MEKILTSESVNIGHPDKTCDYIADLFLDEALRQDKAAQMAVECAIKNDKLFIYGEATTSAKINYNKIARKALKEIGYTQKFKIIKEISEQSPDINAAVVHKRLRANDQGMVYGYASDETPELMPLPILLAHKIMKTYNDFRLKSSEYFADAKAQVSVKYEDGVPTHIDSVLISVSHSPKLSHNQIHADITNNVLNKALAGQEKLLQSTQYLINPSGKFTVWGSFGDSGCVGRKIVVDTYGGAAKVGGGCFSSKNATKVDRSGAYYARYAAKNIVAHNLAKKCEICASYAIGLERPISINIDTFNTEKVPLEDIYKFVNKNFDFSAQNIIDELNLTAPIFAQTACFGHFGRNEFSWEKIKKCKL